MYGKCGSIDEAYDVFEEIVEKDDVSWNTMTISYARHGFGKQTLRQFESMKESGIRPDDVTMLLRCCNLGCSPRASRIHRNIELGKKVVELIFILESWNVGMYVLLSNFYASSGRWRDVSKMRLKIRDTGVRKMPGYNWVEVQNQIHLFSVGDTMHPDNKRIYAFLEELEFLMKQKGYVSTTKLVLHDVDEEEKAHMLKYHSKIGPT
ncbi:hypothetical protein KY289_016852 [Solanum tuberosum]|nr:hypothetical protein KY289_016852 [Solanum tuberosum]